MEISQGLFGVTGDKFPTTREFSEQRHISLVTSHSVLSGLCAENYLELRGKHYYVSFDPNMKNLSKSHLVGVLISDLKNEFFASLSDAVVSCLEKRGYQALIMSNSHLAANETSAIHTLCELPISGIISCIITPKENESLYLNSPIPCIKIASSLSAEGISSVQVNSFSIAQKVAMHLWEQGYRKFLYVGSKYRSLERDERFAGFRMTLSGYGVKLDSTSIIQVDPDSKKITNRLMDFLNYSSEPIGVFCYHDLIAMQLYIICRELGKRIPEDVGIVGFDDLSIATRISPSLTTVQYRVATMADMGVKLLLEKINKPDSPYDNFYIEPNLVVRKSSLLKESSPKQTADS